MIICILRYQSLFNYGIIVAVIAKHIYDQLLILKTF